MTKGELVYEGKAKKVFRTDDDTLFVVSYKDDATALNGKKRGTISGKGVINNRVTNHLMALLEKQGIPTHLVKELSATDTLVKKVTIIPLEVIVRNIAAGSLSTRFGIAEGTVLESPVLEYCYKDDALDDPPVNTYHIAALKLATTTELQTISGCAFKINSILCEYLKTVHLTLVDFKLEFGRLADGTVVLADEISPDTCRLWDDRTNEKLDKDRFRRDLGGVEDAYTEVQKRLLGALA